MIEKSKLFVAIFSNDLEKIEKTIETLSQKIAPIELKSDFYNVDDYTSFYKKEMGDNLKKLFVCFKGIFNPENLADIKKTTMEIEQKFISGDKRTVNIDPGYITLSKLVLATHKNYSHRILLKNEIFAEVTLIYKNKQWQNLSWTYPDYKDKKNQDFFLKVRKLI